ncbi:unnamed protein product, partial [Laminaria digitata]
SAVFEVCWEFPLGVPPGMIEKILTGCCSIGAVRTFWRFGVLVRGTLGGSEGSGSFALVLEYSRETKQLDMKAYGDIRTVAPWAAIAYAISTVRTSLLDFPGLRSQAYLKCPEVEHDGRMSIKTGGPGKELLQGHGCSRCSRETGEVGAAAVELFQMVHVGEARGEVFREVNARFTSAQRHYDALRPAVSPDQVDDLKKEFKEYLESLPFSPGSFGSLDVSLDEVLRRMTGVEAAMHGLNLNVSAMTACTERLDARMGGVEAEVGGLAPNMSAMMAGTERVDARLSSVEAEVSGMATNMPGI